MASKTPSYVGQVGNLRTDWQSVQASAARPGLAAKEP